MVRKIVVVNYMDELIGCMVGYLECVMNIYGE